MDACNTFMVKMDVLQHSTLPIPQEDTWITNSRQKYIPQIKNFQRNKTIYFRYSICIRPEFGYCCIKYQVCQDQVKNTAKIELYHYSFLNSFKELM